MPLLHHHPKAMDDYRDKNTSKRSTTMEMNEEHITKSGAKVEVLNSPTPAAGLTRQGSIAKTTNCLCSPTTHAGSFRCRLHRAPLTLQQAKTMDSRLLKDSRSKANMSAAETTNTGNTVEAQ